MSNALLFGSGGAGKSVTAMLLAVGLSKERHGGAPITLVDREGIAEFLKPICAVEGVPLFVEPSTSFIDMRDALPRAVERGCCVFLVDHYDGAHRDLADAQSAALNLQGRPRQYHHREDLIRLWDAWVSDYRHAPLHTLLTARQAFEWGDDETPEGDPLKVKLGTKARGDADANYEPNLLIEMERLNHFTRDKSKRTIGQIQHVARVIKDRRMTLNGLSFTWNDLNGYTKPGGYLAVWKALSRHFIPATIVGPGGLLRPESVARSSTSLFQPHTGESKFAERARRVTIAIEEIQAALNAIWPGQGGEEKRLRAIVTETLFHSRSWTAIEGMLPETVETGWRIMQHFESAATDPDVPLNVRDEAKVIACIQSCKDLESTRQENVSVL